MYFEKRYEIETELSQQKVTGKLNVFYHLVSQEAHSFRTFSKLLKALQYETALSWTCGVYIFEM